MFKVLRPIRDGSIRAVAYHIVITYVIPLGLPAITAWLGYIQQLPMMHIFVGVVFTFASISVGLLRFDEWLFRRKVENKLVFKTARFVRDVHGHGYFLGVEFANQAHFPIEVDIVELRTQIEKTVPSKSLTGNRRVIVPALGVGWYDDHSITFAIPQSGVAVGLLEFHLKYGRPGTKLSFKLKGQNQVYAEFDQNGELRSASWHEVN